VDLVDSEWQVVAEYVWGPQGPLMQRRYNPAAQSWYNHSYVQDGLGHTRLLLDGNGNAVNRYAYDAWGNLIEYEEAVPNPFTWNGAYGYEWIPLTGLYHVSAREYDPRTARWLQRDPIEASSGDPHFWRYCGNDPLNGVDPSGLFAFDVPHSIHDTLVWFGTVSIWAGIVRDLYKKDVRALSREDNIARLNKQVEWQRKTPKPYQDFLPARNEATAAAGTDATKTNPFWDRLGRFAKSVGKTCLVASVAYDVYEVSSADDPWRKGFESVFGWLGAIAGGTLGAAAGSGPGSVALGVGGAVVGGALGRGFGGWLYDTFF
jgi:RHS repeat-associated protein